MNQDSRFALSFDRTRLHFRFLVTDFSFEVADDRLAAMLVDNADTLKVYGHAILTGDTTSLKQASTKTMEAAAKREAELYGDHSD